jgi:hypothetical protein
MGVQMMKPLLSAILLIPGMALSLHAQPNLPPEGLPAPPPLPAELQDRPMEPPPDLPDISELQEQLRQLQELLSMPAPKLSKLRQTIEFIEKMSPEEREAMHIRLSQITQATPELRTEIASLAALAPNLSKSSISQFWYATSEDERNRLRQRFEELEREEQQALLQEVVEAFIQHRDEAFAKMRATLEKKRDQKAPAP